MEEELKRHRDAYSKLEREKNTEIELLSNRCCPLTWPLDARRRRASCSWLRQAEKIRMRVSYFGLGTSEWGYIR